MASPNFRIGYSTVGVNGPWTWAAYDAPVDAPAYAYIKVELESPDVSVFACNVSSGDPDSITAGLPTVTVNQAAKSATFRLPDRPCTLLITVQINNGLRNSQAYSAYTRSLAVHVLTSYGARLIAVGELDEADRTNYTVPKLNAAIHNVGSGDWIALQRTTDFATTAASAATITMNVDHTEELTVGRPIRILTTYAVDYNDTLSLSGYQNMTGITTQLVDARGRLYVNVVDDTGGYYHIDIYNRSARGASSLVGHTETFNSTGAKDIVSDNSSSLGGTITIGTLGTTTTVIVEFFRWYIVEQISSSLLTLRGPTVPTGAGQIVEIWYGDTNRYECADWYVPGLFASSASTTLLADILGYATRTRGPAMRVCGICATAETLGASAVYVNVSIDGNKVCIDNSSNGLHLIEGWATSAVIQSYYTATTNESAVEITTTIGDGTDDNLSVQLELVRE